MIDWGKIAWDAYCASIAGETRMLTWEEMLRDESKRAVVAAFQAAAHAVVDACRRP